ncbi:hypothetical protein B0F87_101393 [Methylobacter tundripaludum]|uniref:Uncharacterized protein n=1 Tax=Methylobacter tundripaludum TaxID=173365 RepID=A0A2S6HKW3_9GAMM|nr:hypothetical protein [Methylobacter tundripaludum]PPK78011.1 hypothetical protein B0F87_101393 [Methylobacter tundripaludum]
MQLLYALPLLKGLELAILPLCAVSSPDRIFLSYGNGITQLTHSALLMIKIWPDKSLSLKRVTPLPLSLQQAKILPPVLKAIEHLG